jgi:DNA-binding PucR family transcriptional regulator
MHAARQADDGVTAFDQLGIYRLLAEVEDASAVERFVQEWLGVLLDYDSAKGSQLVPTLARYLECGATTTTRCAPRVRGVRSRPPRLMLG